ncbi:Bud site selection protein bud4, partial [Ascosphaera atra]
MSTFSRVFGSPKKRKEMEMRMQQEMQHQAELERMRERAWLTQHVDPWERVRPLVAKDGSFARAYISLSEHEKAAFGRPYTTQVACFNEWAVEPTAASATVASRMSKKSPATMSTMPQMQGSRRRPPYRIGNLELQLLYVPKPKGAEDKDMPKSMNAAVRELKEAQEATTKEWKGFLSQQGGDCPYWRRRFFRLHGNKLTAYHESTLQPRATINLNKAVKLVDDRSILTQKETSTKGGGRRRSAFAEDEEGYMFVEEGFRIRFGNGEVIDFYADGAAQKEGWMEMLSQVIGKGSAGSGSPKAWTELVLKRERQLGFKAGNAPGLQKNDAPMAPPP